MSSSGSIRAVSLLFLLMLLESVVAIAANVAQQQIHIVIQPIDSVSISGNVSLTISREHPEAVDQSTTLEYITNGRDRKITALLNQPLPPDVTLRLELGHSSVEHVLSESPVDVLSGLDQTAGRTTITYRATGTPTTELRTAETTVIFTIAAL